MDVREGLVTSADGTRIKYFVAGRGPRTWIATPAMGAPFLAMSRIYERLADELTIVTWDMRGFYGSADLPNEDALGIAEHVADLEAVRGAVGAARFFSGGWSMGVPISLEHARAHAGAIDGLLLIAGPHERALAPVVPFAAAERPILAALEGLVRHPRPLNAVSRRIGGVRGIGRLLRAVGVVAENESFFEDIVAEFRHVDWGRYLRVVRTLHDHSAKDLDRLQMPALVVAGERDRLTPVESARRLVAALPAAELFVVPRATHYLVSEFPEAVAERVASFCRSVPRA